MKETVNIKINQLPSKTWHWLKLNETNFAWTDEAQGCTIVKKESTENEALSGGKETAEALADNLIDCKRLKISEKSLLLKETCNFFCKSMLRFQYTTPENRLQGAVCFSWK